MQHLRLPNLLGKVRGRVDQEPVFAVGADGGLAWVRVRTRASPAHAKRRVGQRQFHCGNPPPAAEPRTRAVNRPIQDRRKSGSELGRQVPVDLQADADLNEGRGYP